MDFEKISDILKKVSDGHPELGARLQEAAAVSRWESVVGPQISKHAQAVSVKEGVLWVKVDHPIWQSEIHHRKSQILQMLNETNAPGEVVLKDLLILG